MRDELTAMDVTGLMRRLCVAYGKPFGSRTEDLVGLWYDKLRWYPGSVVKAEIERWVETEKRFPTVAAIIALVKARKPPTDAERNVDPDVCPGCRQAFWEAGYEIGTGKANPGQATGTIVPRLRCACPPPGYGWDTPAAIAWNKAHGVGAVVGPAAERRAG